MRFVLRTCVSVVGVALMSSCAAMFTGTKDEITFSAMPSEGTTVIVGDKTYSIDGVPVDVKKKTKKVVFSNPNYGDYEVPVKRKFQGGFLLMDILFTPGYGLVGILIDGGTAGWYKMPSTIQFDFASELARQSTDKNQEGTKVTKSAPKETAAVPASSKAGGP